MTNTKWKWSLTDIKQDKDVKVFSTFSCGGGSSMGYKKAGFKVLGNVEIDPRVNKLYVKNLHPKYNFNMDLRDFLKQDLPDELYHLDILDGSPPCSVFSMAGKRDAGWGTEKVFREGQKKQSLDDLFFVYLDVVEKLKPKIFVAENVTGLVKGKARFYVTQIIKRAHEIGYKVQMFKLNAATMDVPQARERIFFIGNRMNYPKLKLHFNNHPITFREVRTKHGIPIDPNRAPHTYEYLKYLKPTDRTICDIKQRLYGKSSNFNNIIFRDCDVPQTLAANGLLIRVCDKSWLSDDDCRNVSTFPQDYDFMDQKAQYVCGMSVPPNMMEHIASEIYKQWLK